MIDARRIALLVVAAVALAVANANANARGERHGVAAGLAFPRDARVHLAARDEWWSLHGELHAADGARFAFHTTFFRYGLGQRAALHAAFVTMLDERSGRTASVTRVARATDADVRARGVRVDDWSVASVPVRGRGDRIDIAIGDGVTRLALAAYASVAPVPSPAADGYAIVRLRTAGTLTSNGRAYAVRGESWLDHEYEVAGPSRQSAGRDRFELRFDDGRAVELVAPRVADGRYGPFVDRTGRGRERASQPTGDGPSVPARGIVVERDGRSHALRPDDVELVVNGDARWHSPHDGATYPAQWKLSLSGFPPLALLPRERDQELVPPSGGVPAWVGAVDVAQALPPGERLGDGSVELTGYASPFSCGERLACEHD